MGTSGAGASRAGASRAEERLAVSAAVRGGDESAFTEFTERYRRELQVHCYRMLGSFDDAEDLVQETFLRAWRKRETFQGHSTFRAWLYRIATNACLDHLDRHPRTPVAVPTPWEAAAGAPARLTEVPWLQPYPDHLLEPIAPSDTEPDAAAVAGETIELAYLAAIQHLAPRQRAVLILRDVLGWTAQETAALLESSSASVNSALQRARATLRRHLPDRRLDWGPTGDPSREERAVLHRYMAATKRGDLTALAELLREDARFTMPPTLTGYLGRDAVIAGWLPALVGPGAFTDVRHLVTSANRRPAVATYVRRHPDAPAYLPVGLHVLRIEGREIVEITAFIADVLPSFGLPTALQDTA
ncbi:RNA polymerase subunit sigma-70 [Streptomyces sp. FH025]|nr:RNA polymerase subunit sigma-70 [Streptomyces sp. FH025]